MKFKLKLILIISTLILVIIGAAYLLRKSIVKEEAPSTASKPTIPSFVEGELPLKIVDENITKNLPQKLPLIRLKLRSMLEDDSKEIAKNLGFTQEPRTVQGIQYGNTLGWFSDNAYLWITPRLSKIRYGMEQFPKASTNKQLSDSALKNIALDFINNKFNLDKESVLVSSVNYLKLADAPEAGFVESERNEASLFQINLTYKSAEHTVLTKIPSYPIIFVQILPDGLVFKAEGYLVDSISKTDEEYNLLSSEEIINSLSEAELISLRNDYLNLYDLTGEDIINIDITKIEVGYYLTDEMINKYLQPIYLLEGPAQVRSSTANYARLYLPAIK